MQQRTTLIRISDLLKEYLCAFGKYQKNICFKTTTKHSQRKQELYWQMQRQGVKMSNYFYLWKHTPFTVTLALHP